MANINRRGLPKDTNQLSNDNIPTLSRSLIIQWEKSNEAWGARDRQSRFIYANKACLEGLFNLPNSYDIVGKFGHEIPHPTQEFAHIFRQQDELVETTKQRIASIDTFIYGSEQKLAPYFAEKYPLYDDHGNCIGTIFHARKFEVFSIMQYYSGGLPNSLTFNPPIDLFTSKQLEVIFFVLQHMSCKLIAKKMHLSHRTVENKLQEIYQKAGVNSLNALREYCRVEGLERYIPEKYVYPHSKFISLKSIRK